MTRRHYGKGKDAKSESRKDKQVQIPRDYRTRSIIAFTVNRSRSSSAMKTEILVSLCIYKKRKDDRFIIFTAYYLPATIQQCHPHSIRPTFTLLQHLGLARPPGGTLHPSSGPEPAERLRSSPRLARPVCLLPEGPLA